MIERRGEGGERPGRGHGGDLVEGDGGGGGESAAVAEGGCKSDHGIGAARGQARIAAGGGEIDLR